MFDPANIARDFIKAEQTITGRDIVNLVTLPGGGPNQIRATVARTFAPIALYDRLPKEKTFNYPFRPEAVKRMPVACMTDGDNPMLDTAVRALVIVSGVLAIGSWEGLDRGAFEAAGSVLAMGDLVQLREGGIKGSTQSTQYQVLGVFVEIGKGAPPLRDLPVLLKCQQPPMHQQCPFVMTRLRNLSSVSRERRDCTPGKIDFYYLRRLWQKFTYSSGYFRVGLNYFGHEFWHGDLCIQGMRIRGVPVVPSEESIVAFCQVGRK